MARKKKFFDEAARRYVAPRSVAQQQLVDSINQNDITVVAGEAGSGKTLLSIQTLYRMYDIKQIDKIYVIRLVADTFGEHLGALPGEKDEKLEHFLGPIVDNLSEFLPPGKISALIDQKVIEALPVSHCRGRSFANKGVLIEEAQNMTEEMLTCVLTRLAHGSKMVFNGDPRQVDFKGRNGIAYLFNLLTGMYDVGVIKLPSTEVYRHPLVKQIIKRLNTPASPYYLQAA